MDKEKNAVNDPVLSAILNQYEENSKNQSTSSSENTYDLKNYFSLFLPKDQNSGEKSFRILPTSDGTSPFVEVYFHEIQIDGAWKKIPCPNHNDGERCPLCETENALRATGSEEDKKLASRYRARLWYVVKGIDRDAEEEGVKFWRFKHNYKGEGIYDKIIPLISKKGNITDPRNGRDITAVLSRDKAKGYTIVSTIMAEDVSLLTDNAANAKDWLGDERTWKDVYSTKDINYLEIVAKGGKPIYDKDLGKWVDEEANDQVIKEDLEKEMGNIQSEKPVSGAISNSEEEEDELPF